MSDEQPERWPLLPAHAAYTLHGLAIALVDLLQQEGGGRMSRRAVLKANALATVTELIAQELMHFFASRMGDAHEQLEALQEDYLAERRGEEGG